MADQKIIKGIRLSNSEDSFVLSSQKDAKVDELNAIVRELTSSLNTLQAQYTELENRVHLIEYNQEESSHSSSSSNNGNNN